MCCFRSSTLILLEDLRQHASVSGFLPSIKMKKEIQVGAVAVAYDDPACYSTYILVFHQELIVPELERYLLCPFQLHLYGITINKNPLWVTQKNRIITEPHSIIVPGGPVIPLRIRGVMSEFFMCRPTQHKMDQPDNFPKIEMPSNSPEYNPEDKTRTKYQERTMDTTE